jgi:hypothetical protein
MERWYSKALGDGAAAFAPSMRIQQMFPPLFSALGQPSRMAVFSRHDRRTNVVTAYFSPAAAQLAAFFGAQACDKPDSEGIRLLVGDARCWEIYFPDKPRRGPAHCRTHATLPAS